MDLYNDASNNRIVYVDPNNAAGTIPSSDKTTTSNGVPLTPDYTQMTVWCNLTVEPTPRVKNQAKGTDEDNIISVVWQMDKNNGSGDMISFMQGKDAERYNFLTTDYSNIDFDELRKRNIVEGLQIENINISFTNYQTPQITIKFVDIRGGGLFGREEATHNEYGELYNLEERNGMTFDNFFGCFVTFPYPRFRLQVKGFYGKPVTFQLSCTSFNANFNSDTGNFEAVVQFIGYEYGILGDIPFDLLVAAPLTPFGKNYWVEHVQDMANNGWALDVEKSEAPVFLNDFYTFVGGENSSVEKVKDLYNQMSDGNVSRQDLGNMYDILTSYLEIKAAIEDFQRTVKSTFIPEYITEYHGEDDGENSVMIIYSPTIPTTINLTKVYQAHNRIYRLVKNHNQIYGQLESFKVPWGLIPNNEITDTDGEDDVNSPINPYYNWPRTDEDGSVEATEFDIFISYEGERSLMFTKNGGKLIETPDVFTGELINQMQSYFDYNISAGASQQIYDDLMSRDWALHNGDSGKGIPFANFALAINLGPIADFEYQITLLQTVIKSNIDIINANTDELIKKIVDFKPYVGRYFKIVMCHLETFVALINNCVDGIYAQYDAGERAPAALGIYNLEYQTDVPSTFKWVPPFPGVYKRYTTFTENDEDLTSGRNIVANTWVGDISNNWLEGNLVEDLCQAAKRITNTRRSRGNETNLPITVKSRSVSPIDYIFNIPRYAYNSVDGAFLYIGLRARIVTAYLMANTTPSLQGILLEMGMHDAKVFYNNCPNQEFINELMVKLSSDYPAELSNYIIYGEYVNDSERFLYEFESVYNNRHPIFVADGTINEDGVFVPNIDGPVQYTYMSNTSEGYEIVPMDDITSIGSRNGFALNYNYPDGTSFSPKDNNGDTFLITRKNGVDDYDFYNTYPNMKLCKIIKDDSVISEIEETILDDDFFFKYTNAIKHLAPLLSKRNPNYLDEFFIHENNTVSFMEMTDSPIDNLYGDFLKTIEFFEKLNN